MMKPKIQGTKVVFGPCRLSYAHLLEKYVPKDNAGQGKYMTSVLIPKDEKETIKAIEAAIEEAKKTGLTSKWGGKLPKKYDHPLRNGDDKEDNPEYAGHFYITAKTDSRPGIVNMKREPIVDEEEVYSGMWAYVSVNAFPYNTNGNGVSFSLHNVMKFKDDERFGGGRDTAENDFTDLDTEDDDDL